MKKSKTYYKITPKRLRECLEKIWRWLRCSWNGFYYIENQYWETTDVEFYHWDRKESRYKWDKYKILLLKRYRMK